MLLPCQVNTRHFCLVYCLEERGHIALFYISDYFTSAQNPHHEDLLATVQLLKADTDRDVRYFVTYQTQTDIPEIDTVNIFSFFERTIDLND